ncbi:MAG: pyridoxal 5'-phosphate synthase glutaminase subunit PdxT [Thermoplasmatota archaeon]
MKRVGVLAVQGAVSEHTAAIEAAARAKAMDIEVVAVRNPADLDGVHGLILPGGESTTISRLLRSTGLHDVVVARGGKDLAVFGTCAGMILLADAARHDVDDKDIRLLGLIKGTVDRNAFGRQKDSFEAMLDVADIGPMPAVFIRAPAYEDVTGDVLATFDDKIVAFQAGRILGTSFHPELTPDTRLHERFLDLL